MRDFGLVVLVDRDASAIVGFEAGGGQVELVDVTLTAHGIEQGVAGDLFLAFEICNHCAVGKLFDALHAFAKAEGDAGVAEVVAEGLDNLPVGEFEQAVALFNEGDAHAEDGEHAGVFDADDAAADDDQRAGEFRQVKNLVAVDDGAAVDGNFGRVGRFGADGDDDAVGFEGDVPLRAFDADLMGIDEVGDAMDNVDAVARELGLGDVHLGFDDSLHAEGQVGHGDLFLDPVIHAVESAVVVTGEVQNGFAHGFGGDGAGVDADAADHGKGLDNGHALLHFGGGDGGSLPGRPGTNDDQVVLDGAHAVILSRDWMRLEARRVPPGSGGGPHSEATIGRSGEEQGEREDLLAGWGKHGGRPESPAAGPCRWGVVDLGFRLPPSL